MIDSRRNTETKWIVFVSMLCLQLFDWVLTDALSKSTNVAELNPLFWGANYHPNMVKIAILKGLGIFVFTYCLVKTKRLWIYWTCLVIQFLIVVDGIYWVVRG